MPYIHYREWAKLVGLKGDAALKRIQSGSIPVEYRDGVPYVDSVLPLPPKASRWHPSSVSPTNVCVICGSPLPKHGRSTCSETCRQLLSSRAKRPYPPGKPKYDMTGATFGELTLTRYIGHSRYEALCSCGNSCTINRRELINGDTRSCGHLRADRNSERAKLNASQLIGKRFGELSIQSYLGGGFYLAHCSCGNTCSVRRSGLVRGDTSSCGHLRSSLSKQNVLERFGFRYGTMVSRLRRIVSGKLNANNTSGVTGVRPVTRYGMVTYLGSITIQGHHIHLGSFSDMQSAVAARKKAENRYFVPLIAKDEQAKHDL